MCSISLITSRKPYPFCSTAPIAFSVWSVCQILKVICAAEQKGSGLLARLLIPKPLPPPVFDHLQLSHTLCDQRGHGASLAQPDFGGSVHVRLVKQWRQQRAQITSLIATDSPGSVVIIESQYEKLCWQYRTT